MKVWVMIPTYNEKENINSLLQKILKLNIKGLSIVVVDDNSPDGTSKIVEKINDRERNVHLFLRKRKRGRGYAGRAGYLYCLNHGAEVIIEMDGDLSHNPSYIPEMLKWIKEYDIVLGSRMVKGGRDIGRGIIRRAVTKAANLYITLMLGIKVKDCNSGYRCFRRKSLERITPRTLRSAGPAIVQEVLFKAHLKKARIKEIPIKFVNRTKGDSKLGLRELATGYFVVLKLKILHVLRMI